MPSKSLVFRSVVSLGLLATACSDSATEESPASTQPDASLPADPSTPGEPAPIDDGGADVVATDAATALTVLAPLRDTSETRRLLRATIADADGLAKVRYVVNAASPVSVPVTGSPKEIVVKAALALVPGDNTVVIDVEDSLGHVSTTSLAFRYGLVTAAGGSHSGALVSGSLYTFGRNNVGQLGIGPAVDASKSAPTKIVTTATPAALAFNQNSSLFVDATGGVWVWGENTNGELGLGDSGVETRRNTPTANPAVTGAVYAALGYRHTLVLGADGVVRAWGANDLGQVGVVGTAAGDDIQTAPVVVAGLPADIVKVVAGSSHSIALTASGDVFVWGRNTYGNLGGGAVDTDRHPTPAKVPGLTDVVDVANGRDHVLAVKADGSVVSWGLGASGQLGYGDPVGGDFASPRATPAAVATSGDGAKKLGAIATVYANGNTSFALARDGKLWGWGEDGNGTLAQGGAGGAGAMAHKAGYAVRAGVYALGSGTPEYLDERAKLRSIAVGALHVVVRTDKNELYSWGWNTNGTLGIPDFPAIWRQPTPALVQTP